MGKSEDEGRHLNAIVKAKDSLTKLEIFLEQRTGALAVLSVDLANSTKLKARPQKEWLPIICRFLVTVSETIEENQGRIIKYIGDEVFAAFEDRDTGLAANRAEAFIWECQQKLHTLGSEFSAKYTLDYGEAAAVQIKGAPPDILGTVVDRCARVAHLLARPGAALATEEFVQNSKNSNTWRLLVELSLKGIVRPCKVYQLQGLGKLLVFKDPDLLAKPHEALITDLVKLRRRLDACTEEVRILRSR